MKISDWQKKEKLTDKELAKLWGYDPSMISYIRNGQRLPSPRKATKLVEISNGEITLIDIYSLSKND